MVRPSSHPFYFIHLDNIVEQRCERWYFTTQKRDSKSSIASLKLIGHITRLVYSSFPFFDSFFCFMMASYLDLEDHHRRKGMTKDGNVMTAKATQSNCNHQQMKINGCGSRNYIHKNKLFPLPCGGRTCGQTPSKVQWHLVLVHLKNQSEAVKKTD